MLSKNIPPIYCSSLIQYTQIGNYGTDINKSQNIITAYFLKNALRFESPGRLLGILVPRE